VPCEEVKKVRILWASVEGGSWVEVGSWAGVLDLRVQIQAEVLETILKDREYGFAMVSLSAGRSREWC